MIMVQKYADIPHVNIYSHFLAPLR